MSGDRSQPFAWWGSLQTHANQKVFSLVQLVDNHSLSASVAALLFLAMEHRSSIVVATQPRLAGKTTMLTALLPFLRPEVRKIYLHGSFEDYEFLPGVAPDASYLLVNELSDHLPYYLWGRPAQRLFQLLPLGFAMGATMHADTPEEVAELLRYGLGITETTVGQITLVINLELMLGQRGYEDARRRVGKVSVYFSGRRGRLGSMPLAVWDSRSDSCEVLLNADAVELLGGRLGMTPEQVKEALAQRERLLLQWLQDGVHSPTQVQNALQSFYRGNAE
jgi:hypothetical protein